MSSFDPSKDSPSVAHSEAKKAAAATLQTQKGASDSTASATDSLADREIVSLEEIGIFCALSLADSGAFKKPTKPTITAEPEKLP